ncbi:MAG TPA: Gfo/Idh/MocA family oxidoreductase [Kofleriaceae bacterium]|nr:Gfo/Idh/MocA family oxidoreductase [Kofleriaceae bacterium]
MKIGIIGTRWGLMHVGGFRGAGAEVAALCGAQAERTREVAAREGIPLATVDVDEMCRAVDVVVVASPDARHAEHVRAALDRGRPVLCEKPLATGESDAARMAAWARASGRACAVNFPYRCLPPVARLKAHIEGRPVTERVRHVACTIENAFAAAASDASGDMGGVSHLIDAALWLAGGHPVWVHASIEGRPARSAALQVGVSTGALLVITQIACSEPGIRGRWLVAGDSWEASFAGGYEPARGGWSVSAVRLADASSTAELAPGALPLPGRREPWAEAHVDTARHFLRAAAGGELAPLAGFDQGLAVQRVLAAALASDQRRARVDLAGPAGDGPQ